MRVARVRDVKLPERGTSKSAGIDFFVPNTFIETTVEPGRDLLIPSGIRADVPAGYMLMAAEKSGVVTSRDAMILNGRTPKPDSYNTVVVLGAKIVDEDYQGEIHIHVINVGTEPVVIKPGKKLAQFILIPVSYDEIEEVAENDLFAEASERGEGGFGSTNKEENNI